MTGILILEIISLVSFIYSVLLVPFSFGSLNSIYFIFAWTVLIAILFALNHNKSKFHSLVMLLMFLPLYFYRERVALYFILISTFLIHSYIKKTLNKSSYSEYITKLKTTYQIYIGVVIVGLLSKGFYSLVNYSIPFIIIYLMTTIILVRTLRHIESNMDLEKLRKTNIKYLAILLFISSLVALDGLRNFIFNIIKSVYLFAIDTIMYILYYPLMLIGYIITKIVEWIFVSIPEDFLEGLIPELAAEGGENIGGYVETAVSKSFQFGVEILFIILVLYLLYRLITKMGDRSYSTIEYHEEREYIGTGRKRKRRFFRERFPKDLKDQVRYYYRKYLNKVNDKRKILKADTSIDVNEKATGFDKDLIEGIRNIYIDIRYGNKEVKEETVKEIEDLYKKL